ncbi:MAG TPA: RluA family pseudouridine synthase, partial [Aliiroseovarius sp.]|nr:RluA family pseudouridine synthase [Aliiroseovarius sp.]
MSRVQVITVAKDEAEQRLDRWFRRRFPDVGQGRIEKMCRKGEIRVDGGRVKPGTRIGPGAQIRVPPLPGPDPNIGDRHKRARAGSGISDEDAAMIQACVLYRDDDIIALNKPPGLPVQGGSGHARHIDGLAEALRFGADKPRLVHRLDKDTSGILLLARSPKAASALTRAFRDRATRKIYWALAAGLPVPRMGSIKFGLVKSAGHGKGGEGEKMRLVHPREVDTTPGAKHALTDY